MLGELDDTSARPPEALGLPATVFGAGALLTLVLAAAME